MNTSAADIDTQRFPHSRFREWLSFFVPYAIGIGSVDLATNGSLQQYLLLIGAGGAFTGLLERLRPARAVVVTTESLSLPSRWARTTTVSRAAIDVAASSTSSLWDRVNGIRRIRLLDGSRLFLNVLALGSSQVHQILSLLGCAAASTRPTNAA